MSRRLNEVYRKEPPRQGGSEVRYQAARIFAGNLPSDDEDLGGNIQFQQFTDSETDVEEVEEKEEMQVDEDIVAEKLDQKTVIQDYGEESAVRLYFLYNTYNSYTKNNLLRKYVNCSA